MKIQAPSSKLQRSSKLQAFKIGNCESGKQKWMRLLALLISVFSFQFSALTQPLQLPNMVERYFPLGAFQPASCGHAAYMGHGTVPIGQVGVPVQILSFYQNRCTCGDHHKWESVTQTFSIDEVGVGGVGNLVVNGAVVLLFTNDASFVLWPIGTVTITNAPLLLAPGVGAVVTNFFTFNSEQAGLFVSRAEIAGTHYWDAFGGGDGGAPTGASIGSSTAIMLPPIFVARQQGNILVSFDKPPSIRVRLQSSPNMKDWTTLGWHTEGETGFQSYQFPMTGELRYFRLQ